MFLVAESLMNIKKTLSALMVGAMVLSAAPVLPASASFVSTAYAAKGGAKMSIPKSAPAPKAPAAGATSNGSTSKSVSGNGSSYAPSKDAKSLEKNAPAANAKSNAAAANAKTQSSSRLGSIMRGIGIFAGGMLLGSMLSHLFGMGSGMFADILGLLMNGLLIVVAIMAVRWLWNKFRGNKTSASSAITARTSRGASSRWTASRCARQSMISSRAATTTSRSPRLTVTAIADISFLRIERSVSHAKNIHTCEGR